MKNTKKILIISYVLTFFGFILFGLTVNKGATVVSQSAPLKKRHCFIIDPGHGGVDGGAVSCTGVYESKINLDISLRLNDLFHLLGYDTLMIRTEDISIHTTGNSIAAKKASDLKERVRIVNETENSILLSIHQNHYSDSYYSGGQMFYPKTEGSKKLAENLQHAFVSILNPGSNRKAKPAEGLYLMKHIEQTGVLIECGFLSNAEEEYNLRQTEYQKKICSVIATECGAYLNLQSIT